jgi:hypothetical protein
VGEEKKMMMSKMYAEPDLETMQRVRCAFDPEHLSNPTKVFPQFRPFKPAARKCTKRERGVKWRGGGSGEVKDCLWSWTMEIDTNL